MQTVKTNIHKGLCQCEVGEAGACSKFRTKGPCSKNWLVLNEAPQRLKPAGLLSAYIAAVNRCATQKH